MRSTRHPVVRVSRGGFAAENYGEVKRLIDESAAPLIPAIDSLSGLLYYHAGVDPATNTVVNVSVWESEQAARQMDTLPAMLAQRPILETAGVTFDRIANYPPAWTIERDQAAVLSGSELLDILFKSASERWAKLGFTTRLIRSNGVDLHVAGGGAGRPLLLLHGYPQSGEIWRLIAPELARAYRLIIPDLRGMGLSGIAEVGYDLPTVAEDIHQLLRTLDVTTADVVGHDWGGAVAAVYALRYRDEVRSLTFIESAVAGAGFETIWSFTQPNPAMTFIPFLLSEPLAEKLITAREETFLHHPSLRIENGPRSTPGNLTSPR